MAHRKRRDLIGPLSVRKQTYPLTPWVDSSKTPRTKRTVRSRPITGRWAAMRHIADIWQTVEEGGVNPELKFSLS